LIDIFIFYSASKEWNHPTQKFYQNDGNAIVSKFKNLVPKIYPQEELKKYKIHYVNDGKRQSITFGKNKYVFLYHTREFQTFYDLLNIMNKIIIGGYYETN